MTKTLFALLLWGVAASAPAVTVVSDKPGEAPADMCAQGTCQRDLKIVLRREDGSVYERQFEVMPPIVQPAFVVVLAGQTVYLEADIVDGRLANIVAIDKVRDPARTITASLRQEAGGAGMMLEVRNPFGQALKFDMGIMPLGRGKLLKTSSCPIGAGLVSYEMWPEPLLQVVLAKGRVVPVGANMVCV